MMIQSVWLIAQEGADRIYVQTSKPVGQFAAKAKVYRAEIELPGYDSVDGVIRVVATPVDSLHSEDKTV